MKITPRICNMVVLRDNNDLPVLMMSGEPFTSFFTGCFNDATSTVFAIPQDWPVSIPGAIRYSQTVPINVKNNLKDSWINVCDGRFFTKADNLLILEMLAESNADVIAVNITPQLQASYEKVLTTSQNGLVGFRLFYEDATRPAPVPDNWPHHIFIRASSLEKLEMDDGLPLAFDEFLDKCSSKSLQVQSVEIGGSTIDLITAGGLLDLVRYGLSSKQVIYSQDNDISVAAGARFIGQTLLGRGVIIGENAIIAGPSIIGDGVNIGKDAVVKASLIGPGISVAAGKLIENSVLTQNIRMVDKSDCSLNMIRNNFRQFSKFSYAGLLKRLLDIAIALIVLILFAPVIPIIMLAIKLTSPGPIFFKDMRQGLYGRAFNCLKFRSMKVGSESMQERLRCLNQADGPQFSITDDPRVSAVGKFLRETYLDEIPQFINVLVGQMSVVGPRPSPEAENILCPFWRDARLSVRPGMTGLWQVRRTRQPMRDFQEWIHYDLEYVRDLSLKMDLSICLQTAKKVAKKFFEQF